MSVLDGPNEGTWSAFAEQVVDERDEALALVARLRAQLALASDKLACEEGKTAARDDEIRDLRAQLAEVTKERDEARDLLKQTKGGE